VTASEQLLKEVKAHIKAEALGLFKQIEDYGGEFSEDEINAKSFNAPAAFVACLGWRKAKSGNVLAGKKIWRTRIAIFVVTKNTKREVRMTEAMQRAEVLSTIFEGWRPVEVCTSNPDGIDAENLYSRAVDKAGLALWMVGWWQEIEMKKGQRPEMPDLEKVEIESVARTMVDAAAPSSPETAITHKLEMNNAES
jgi:hypothetical protein